MNPDPLSLGKGAILFGSSFAGWAGAVSKFERMIFDFVGRGPAAQVQAEHLVSRLGRLGVRPESDQQCGDDGEIDLQRHARGAVADQVPSSAVSRPARNYRRSRQVVSMKR